MMPLALSSVSTLPQPQGPGSIFCGSPGHWSKNSYAPMSQIVVPSPLPSAGRARPRWSTSGQMEALPASMAGLVLAIACVGAGPPLSASGPSCGSTLAWSEGPSRAQVPSVSMFLLPESKS